MDAEKQPTPVCGTVALVGRPNAGKSTLMNGLLGEKVSIVSDKPQTTRHRMVGILSEPRGQVIFHDTPGIHKPLHRLNRVMLNAALEAMMAADVVALLIDASTSFGRGDAMLLERVRGIEKPKILLLNKVDLVAKPKLLPLIARYSEGGAFDEIVPISALEGDGLPTVLDLLFERLPAGPPTYDTELLTVHPERFLVVERIREKLLAETRDELPFTTAVRLDRWEEDAESGMITIYASILVDRPGQKGIVIGKGGAKLKAIGTAAREDLEGFLGTKIYLDLHVKSEPGWRESPRVLGELDRDVDLALGLIEPKATD